jgi:rubredoxin
MTENHVTRPEIPAKWVRRCPICLSDRNDFYLGGKISFQLYKCLDCGYIGAAFIEVDPRWSPSKESPSGTKAKDT